MAKIKIKCDTCGKEFEKYESKLSVHNFCCRECYNKFHSRNTPQSICEVCGKEFAGSKYNANRFCSRECYNVFHAIKNKVRICPTCKKEFVAKTSNDKYCCRACYDADRHMPSKENHWNWQGGVSTQHDNRDSTEYKKWRQAVYERDNFCCTQCGSKIKINAHHIKSWKNYPHLRYEVSNGITLCEKCHIKYHQQYGYDDVKTV